ncbi:MAG: hypothetical protein ACXWQR_23050 [Ktedonobacterales bacterium]
MNGQTTRLPQTTLTQVIIIFIALAVGGVIFTLAGAFSADPAVRSAFTGLGSAVFGSGLTFFLVEFFARTRQSNPS